MIETVIIRPQEHTAIFRLEQQNAEIVSERHTVTVHDEVEIIEVGVQGPPGRNGVGADFEQTFTDATESIVNHNLGRFPVTSIFSAGGAEMDAEVLNVSLNQLIIYFLVPTSGSVRCI